MSRWFGSIVCIWILVLAALAAAQPSSERTVVPFSDPTRPGTVRVGLLTGGITVTGYAGKEVLVHTASRDGDEDGEASDEPSSTKDEEQDDRARGLRKVTNLSAGLSIEEAENVVEISSRSYSHGFDLEIQVPVGTSLDLATVNDGDIVVRNVDGEINVENTNGEVALRDVSGSVVAHALNGDVTVALQRVDPKKEMSFTSLNGNVDVTLPTDVHADLRVKSDNGEIYTDFDIKLDARSEARDSDPKSLSLGDRPARSSRRRHYGFENVMSGTLNGGGPTLRFQTFNGNIYIRKAK
jgi:hypothetical protein